MPLSPHALRVGEMARMLLVVCALAARPAHAQAGSATVIEGVTVIDVERGARVVDQTIVVTGARITATLVSELDRRGARYGVASMCIGQGQAIAAVVERL